MRSKPLIEDWEVLEKEAKGTLWKAIDSELNIIYVVYIGRKRRKPEMKDFDFKILKTGKRTLQETAWAFYGGNEALRGATRLFNIHCK